MRMTAWLTAVGISLTTLGVATPAAASAGGDPDFIWVTGVCCDHQPSDLLVVRRDSRRPGPCRGSAKVTVHYDVHGMDVKAYLMPYRQKETTSWPEFRRGDMLWRSGLLPATSAGTVHGRVPVTGTGELASLGVLALDPKTGHRIWFRNWMFVLDCGRDNEILIDDTLAPAVVGQANRARPQ